MDVGLDSVGQLVLAAVVVSAVGDIEVANPLVLVLAFCEGSEGVFN